MNPVARLDKLRASDIPVLASGFLAYVIVLMAINDEIADSGGPYHNIRTEEFHVPRHCLYQRLSFAFIYQLYTNT